MHPFGGKAQLLPLIIYDFKSNQVKFRELNNALHFTYTNVKSPPGYRLMQGHASHENPNWATVQY